MTLRTVASHLAAVKIRMAVGALASNAAKYKLDVALPAVHFLMHTAKGESGFGVPEVRKGPDWPETCGSMTVPACNAQRPVRASRALPVR